MPMVKSTLNVRRIGENAMASSTPSRAPMTLNASTRSTSQLAGDPAASSRLRIFSTCPLGVSRRPSPLLLLTRGSRTRSLNGRSSSDRMLAGAAWKAWTAARLRPTCSRSPVRTPIVASTMTTAQKMAASPTMRAMSAIDQTSTSTIFFIHSPPTVIRIRPPTIINHPSGSSVSVRM